MNTALSLKDIYKGQSVWLVGKGPSLEYIQKHHFDDGIVIALYEAIIAVEELNLPNPIFSLQKDGGDRKIKTENNLCPDCHYTDQCGESCGSMIRPKKAILLLHDLESNYCFSDYLNRVVFDLETLNLQNNIHSAVFAVKIALFFGCNEFHFLCFDASVNGDNRTYVPGKGIVGSDTYGNQKSYIDQFINNFKSEWKIPTESGDLI